MQNAKNVGTSKPGVNGTIFFATLAENPTVPTDATTALPATYKPLGFLSSDAVSIEPTRESEDIKAFGGSVVASPQTDVSLKATFTLIEYFSKNVQEFLLGADHVTVDDETGEITAVAFNRAELPRISVVMELEAGNDRILRKVFADCKVTETGEINHADDDVIQQEVTITGFEASNGDFMKEYFGKKA